MRGADEKTIAIHKGGMFKPALRMIPRGSYCATSAAAQAAAEIPGPRIVGRLADPSLPADLLDRRSILALPNDQRLLSA